MKDKLRELLYKYTDKVDNWNDAIFTDEFDDLVDELDALFAKRKLNSSLWKSTKTLLVNQYCILTVWIKIEAVNKRETLS